MRALHIPALSMSLIRALSAVKFLESFLHFLALPLSDIGTEFHRIKFLVKMSGFLPCGMCSIQAAATHKSPQHENKVRHPSAYYAQAALGTCPPKEELTPLRYTT